MPPEEALCQPWLWNAIGSCVSHDQLCHATGWEYAFEWDVSTLTEWDHFQRLKPYVLLSSSHKDFVWLQKTWNATQLVCNALALTLKLYLCMSRWLNEWMNEWVYEWMTVWMNEWMNEWVYEWMNEWINQSMNQWINECTFPCLNLISNPRLSMWFQIFGLHRTHKYMFMPV